MMEWSFYDFVVHWDVFLRQWKSREIQESLEVHMQYWCEFQAFPNIDDSVPQWRKGDPLWHLSRTDYWNVKICRQVDAHLDRNKYYENYKQSMERVYGKPLKHCQNSFDYLMMVSGEYDNLYGFYSPQPDTIESLILVSGKNHISECLYTIACDIFRNQEVLMVKDDRNNDMILIPEEKKVYDLLDFYYWKYDNVSSLLKDTSYYDEIVRLHDDDIALSDDADYDY
jgi:hypothetical protein